MRYPACGIVIGLLALAASSFAHGAEEDTTVRLKEMLHRTQEALRQAQSDNADLTRAKAEAEQKLQAASSALDAAQSGSKAASTSLHSQLSAAQTERAQLNQKINEANDRIAAAAAKLNEASRQAAARDAELAQVNQGAEQGKTAVAGCEAKNLTLYQYSMDLLKAYRNKGVWASLEQKDPVLGLKDVDVQNVVQEYRVKLSAQKTQP